MVNFGMRRIVLELLIKSSPIFCITVVETNLLNLANPGSNRLKNLGQNSKATIIKSVTRYTTGEYLNRSLPLFAPRATKTKS